MLLQLRLPRVILAALVGAALAIAGAAYQGVFRNPLADPYLLGAAAGAGLGATLVIAYSPAQSLGPVGHRAAGRLRRRAGRASAARWPWARRPAARRAPPCCSPGSPSPSFLAAAQTLVQQQNTDDLRAVYGWLLGQLGRAQWSDIALVLPYLGAARRRAAALRPGARRAGGRRRRGPLARACTPAGCG